MHSVRPHGRLGTVEVEEDSVVGVDEAEAEVSAVATSAVEAAVAA